MVFFYPAAAVHCLRSGPCGLTASSGCSFSFRPLRANDPARACLVAPALAVFQAAVLCFSPQPTNDFASSSFPFRSGSRSLSSRPRRANGSAGCSLSFRSRQFVVSGPARCLAVSVSALAVVPFRCALYSGQGIQDCVSCARRLPAQRRDAGQGPVCYFFSPLAARIEAPICVLSCGRPCSAWYFFIPALRVTALWFVVSGPAPLSRSLVLPALTFIFLRQSFLSPFGLRGRGAGDVKSSFTAACAGFCRRRGAKLPLFGAAGFAAAGVSALSFSPLPSAARRRPFFPPGQGLLNIPSGSGRSASPSSAVSCPQDERIRLAGVLFSDAANRAH